MYLRYNKLMLTAQIKNEKKIILGIDPGLLHTGWAVICKKNNKDLSYIDSGVIHSIPKIGNGQKKSQYFAIKLGLIFAELEKIINRHKPNTTAIENTYVNTNFNSSLKLSQARAAAILACTVNDLQITEYQAKTVKKTLTGSGIADKTQMTKMINLYLRDVIMIRSYDEADAIAIAICHAQHN